MLTNKPKTNHFKKPTILILIIITLISCSTSKIYKVKNIEAGLFTDYIMIILQDLNEKQNYYVFSKRKTISDYDNYNILIIDSNYYFELIEFKESLISKRYLHDSDINFNYSFDTCYSKQNFKSYIGDNIINQSYNKTNFKNLTDEDKAEIAKSAIKEIIGDCINKDTVKSNTILKLHTLVLTNSILIISNNENNFLYWSNDTLQGTIYYCDKIINEYIRK